MRTKLIMGTYDRPQRLLVYGPEGIGKSTLAASLPDPVFIDTEDGTAHLPVTRFPRPATWVQLLDFVSDVTASPEGFSTLVLDTTDAAEKLCIEHILNKHNKKSIEAWGYGKGYTVLKEEFQHLLDALDLAVGAGLNVCLTAHAQIKKFERPDEQGAYDRFELKLSRQNAPVVKEWADAVLFCDYKTFVSSPEDGMGKNKATGGKRVIRTSHHPSWDAKNRWGLPDELSMDDAGIAEIILHLPGRMPAKKKAEPKPEPKVETKPEPEPEPETEPEPTGATARTKTPLADGRFKPLVVAMRESGVNIDEVFDVLVLRKKVSREQAVEDWPQDFIEWILTQWDALVPLVKQLREDRANAEKIETPF